MIPQLIFLIFINPRIDCFIPKQLQELVFLRAKAPRLNRSKMGQYSNMDPFSIFQPRDFRAAKKPTLEVVWVYIFSPKMLYTNFVKSLSYEDIDTNISSQNITLEV